MALRHLRIEFNHLKLNVNHSTTKNVVINSNCNVMNQGIDFFFFQNCQKNSKQMTIQLINIAKMSPN